MFVYARVCMLAYACTTYTVRACVYVSVCVYVRMRMICKINVSTYP